MFLKLLAVSALLFSGCNLQDLSLQEQLARAESDPSHLLSIFAGVLGSTFVIMLVFGGQRGLFWSFMDSVCIVGLLSLVTCPIYWATSGHWKVSLGIGVSGLLSLLATAFLYWRYSLMPERRPIFPQEEPEERRQRDSEEGE